MKKFVLILTMFISVFCLSGCGKKNVNDVIEEVKKIELTGNLVTYEAYYHNVIEYEKKAGSGVTHLFEKNRKLFAEYTGIIKLGINLSKVKIEVKENEINVFIPKAVIIGEPNVDKDDFKSENFIESDDGINKNPITVEDSSKAFDKAQKSMKEFAAKDNELLSIAQKRAKIILEENLKQLGVPKDYLINWEYEQ